MGVAQFAACLLSATSSPVDSCAERDEASHRARTTALGSLSPRRTTGIAIEVHKPYRRPAPNLPDRIMLGQLVAHVRRDETTRIIRQVRRVRRIDILREQLLAECSTAPSMPRMIGTSCWSTVNSGRGPAGAQLRPARLAVWHTEQQIDLDLWVEDFGAAHDRVMSLGARVLKPAVSANSFDNFQVYADPVAYPFLPVLDPTTRTKLELDSAWVTRQDLGGEPPHGYPEGYVGVTPAQSPTGPDLRLRAPAVSLRLHRWDRIALTVPSCRWPLRARTRSGAFVPFVRFAPGGTGRVSCFG